MKKVTAFIDDILKLIAVSYTLLVIAGYVDLSTYYAKFGVKINEYISASEILLLSLDKLALVLGILAIHFIIWLPFFDLKIGDNTLEDNSDTKLNLEILIRKLFNKKIKIYYLFSTIGMIATVPLALSSPKNVFLSSLDDFFMINYWITISIHLLWALKLAELLNLFRKHREYSAKIIVTFIVFFSVLITALWAKNFLRFNQIRKFGNEKNYTIFMDNGRAEQTDTIRYIGRTENYVFYWDKITRNANIYPIGTITKILER